MPNISCRRLDIYHTSTHGLSANLECIYEMCCTRLAENAGRKKSPKKLPSGHHRTTLSGYIFATKECIDNRKKNLLNSNISSTCLDNKVNFGPLQLRSVDKFGAPQQVSTGFASWLRYYTNVAQQRSAKLWRMFGRLIWAGTLHCIPQKNWTTKLMAVTLSKVNGF